MRNAALSNGGPGSYRGPKCENLVVMMVAENRVKIDKPAIELYIYIYIFICKKLKLGWRLLVRDTKMLITLPESWAIQTSS